MSRTRIWTILHLYASATSTPFVHPFPSNIVKDYSYAQIRPSHIRLLRSESLHAAASSAGGDGQGKRQNAGGARFAQEHGGNSHRPAGVDLIVDKQDRSGSGVGPDGGGEAVRHREGAPERVQALGAVMAARARTKRG